MKPPLSVIRTILSAQGSVGLFRWTEEARLLDSGVVLVILSLKPATKEWVLPSFCSPAVVDTFGTFGLRTFVSSVLVGGRAEENILTELFVIAAVAELPLPVALMHGTDTNTQCVWIGCLYPS